MQVDDKAVAGGIGPICRRNYDDLVPGPKGKVMSGVILVSGEAGTAWFEVTMDSTMDREETLCLRHCGPIVEVTTLALLDAGQNLAIRSRVAYR